MKFYGYAKCGTCKKATKWLDAQGVAYEFIDITEQPPTLAELKQALDAGYTIKELFNKTGGQYRDLNMKYKLPTMSLDDALGMLADDGYLVKRPFAISGNKLTIGFKEEVYAEAWG